MPIPNRLTSELKKLVNQFQQEVQFNKIYEDFDILSVFIDKKDKSNRIIVIVEEHVDIEEVNRLAQAYFKKASYKIISREGKPKGTSVLQTGRGVRHSQSVDWGTFGGIFKVRGDNNHVYGLSNNHVIANLNEAQGGDRIISWPNQDAGQLFRYISLRRPPGINQADAAIFQINRNIAVQWNPRQPNGAIGPQLNMRVYKTGAATGLTRGIITGFNGSVRVLLNGQEFHFNEIVAIKGISGLFNTNGDSGSMVLSERGDSMVAVVFALFHEYCYAFPVSKIKPLLL